VGQVPLAPEATDDDGTRPSATAMPTSVLSVPNRVAVWRTRKPPAMAPAMAPLPTNPNSRRASRVVST
jgi:hypothetical protein